MANQMGTNAFDGAISPGQVTYDGVDFGKTIDNIEVERVVMYKEIMKAQYGGMMDDQVQIGEYWRIKIKIAEITYARMVKWNPGITLSGAGTAAKFGDQMYKSFRDNYAKVLLLTNTDSDGNLSTDDNYIITLPKAIPVHTSEPYTWGPEDQRVVDIEFHALKDHTNNIYLYCGAASSLGL